MVNLKKQIQLRKIVLIICLIIASLILKAQNYWQQQSDHRINVTLNTNDQSLNAFESIQYSNKSPDTLNFIWFHIWPNAYKNDRTAFCEQMLKAGNTNFYFSDEEKRGYINQLDFRVNGELTKIEQHPIHQDIIKVVLPHPLIPGQSIKIETPFHVKLPEYSSRSGYLGDFYQITQWFPKPAVYDKKGWHEMPYLDQGEFFSEFGNYDVTITAPSNYVIAATGLLKEKNNEDSISTWHYMQENIHDFAFFAGKDYITDKDTLQLQDSIIEVYSYHLKDDKVWSNSISMIKKAILTKSKWIGNYPYSTVKVVQLPKINEGGMEYPTITLVGSALNEKKLEYLINHEVGHNWFYGILASNERNNAWMDEGMNTYYDKRYEKEILGIDPEDEEESMMPKFFKSRSSGNTDNLMLRSVIANKKDQPIQTSSEIFSIENYDIIVYEKTSQWLKLLEQKVGLSKFDEIMHEYYQTWKFKHPYPDDFKKIAEETTKSNLDSIFNLINKKGALEVPIYKDFKLKSLISFNQTDKHNYIFYAPSLGYNNYDKLMAGIFIHNYTLPSTKLQYYLSPMYAVGSNKIRGLGGVYYTFYPGNNDSRLTVGLTGSTFSNNIFKDSTCKKNFLYFYKITPSLKYDFKSNGSINKYIEWKTYLISEKTIHFSRDTIQQVDIITYPKEQQYINQLKFSWQDQRVLYPYSLSFIGEQSKRFIRLNFIWEEFFNYSKKDKDGLQARFYAGKFIYLNNKTTAISYETNKYHLNLTGNNGYEDYTYSNYFIGRNDFEGIWSQQTMIRDGSFKVHTDLLSNKIGKTDNWLTTLNLTSALPSKINPLSILPVIIPLKVFFDMGTYAEAWENNTSTGKILYDAGLQISLFNDVVQVYMPILYSKVFRDYYKSTITEKRFLKTVSFSIDIEKIPMKEILNSIRF